MRYLQVLDPGKKTKTFNSMQEYEAWKQGNMDRIEGDIGLGRVRDKEGNVLSVTITYGLKKA